MTISVLFVCLGNICRSPTAHGVFLKLLAERGLGSEAISVESAGTGAWHVGESPDPRAIEAAARRGVDLEELRGQQVQRTDFERFDYILAMDQDNLNALEQLKPEHFTGYLGLLLDFHPDPALTEVPDPYYGGESGFDRVLDMIELSCQQLMTAIEKSPHGQ